MRLKNCTIVLILLMAAGAWGSQVANIDFANLKERISGDTLTFARNSVAYDDSGAYYAANAARKQTVLCASPVEITQVAGYKVMTTDNSYIYARDASGLVIYRSVNGSSFLKHSDTVTYVKTMFTSSAGTIFYGNDVGAETQSQIYRWSGAAWVSVLTMETPGATIEKWNVAELNGYLFVSEYGPKTANNARKIYCSNDDGLTWRKIYSPDAVTGRHTHRIVPAMVNDVLCLYVACGDPPLQNLTKLTNVTDENGYWTASDITLTFSFQPTAGIWLPESDAIVWGSDGNPMPCGMMYHDLATDVISLKYNTTFDVQGSSTNDYYFIFDMRKICGVYYALASDSTSTYGRLLASADGLKWVSVAQLATGISSFIGASADGKLWWKTGNTDSYYCNLVNIAYVRGLIVEKLGNNRFDNTITGAASGTVVAAYSEDGLRKDTDNSTLIGSYRWQNDTNPITANKTLAFGTESVPQWSAADQLIYMSFWVKGSLDPAGVYLGSGRQGKCTFYAELYDNSETGNKTTGSVEWFPTGDWQNLILCMKTPPVPTGGFAGINCVGTVYARADNTPETDNMIFDIRVDNSVNYGWGLCPVSWNVKNTNKLADVVSRTVNIPATFTDIVTVLSRVSDREMFWNESGDSKSYIYLKSYRVDNANFLAVVYDVYDKKVKLVQATGEAPTVLAESSAISFYRLENIVFAVTRSSATAAKLHVWTASGYQSLDATITDQTYTSEFWGCHPAGTQGGNLVFARSVMHDEVLSDVKAAMQWPNTVNMMPEITEVSGGGRLGGRF